MAEAGRSGGVTMPRDEVVDSILNVEFPLKPLYEAMGKSFTSAQLPEEQLKAVQARRAVLQQHSDAELVKLLNAHRARQQANAAAAAAEKQRKKAADAAAREAKRFYNTPGLQVDWDHWARLEYWTFDESIALLLRRDPKVVTPAAVRREIDSTKMFLGPPMSKFLEDYERLRSIAERASAMTSARGLRPRNVLSWAAAKSGFEPPAELVTALDRRQPIAAPAPSPAAQIETPQTRPPGVPASQQQEERAPIVKHTVRATRRDILMPAVEEAQRRCGKPTDTAAVWATLATMADERTPPLIGCTEDGIQYLRDGQAAILTRDALNKRLKRRDGSGA